MSKQIVKKILDHPDKDEIISKLVIGISGSDIKDWLEAKYPNDSRLVLSERSLKLFNDNYLDIYQTIKEDLQKVQQNQNNKQIGIEEELQLTLQNNSAYKNHLTKLAKKEVDIKEIITNMVLAIETRASQVFDSIQEDPRNINTRMDRILIEWFDTLGNILEKYHKIVNEAPDQIVQHNFTVQVVDQHINVIQETIKEVLSNFDVEVSLHFMEVLNEKLQKVKMANNLPVSADTRLMEAKLLNESIQLKIDQDGNK